MEEAEGGTALKLTFTGESWGGMYLILGKYDASGSGTVAMRLKLPEDVANLELKLEGPETNTQSVNLMEYAAGRDDAGWRDIHRSFGRVQRDRPVAGHDPRLVEPLGPGRGVHRLRSDRG